MVEELIDYYSTNLTFYNLVTRKLIWWKKLIPVLLFLAVAALFVVYFIKLKIYLLVLCLPCFGVALFLGRRFNALKVKELYQRHSISKFSWSTEGFHQDAVQNLNGYFERKGWDENKIQKIQELIKEKADKERTGSIIFISCLGALFIPLWNVYLDKLMGQFNTTEDLSILFAVLLFLITAVSYLMINLADIRDNFITRFVKLNKLNELISEVLLSR
ncbi:hypothetical protein SAMN05421820_1044 [Pedobacter steynii]|uniref:Uncharacterized protein n=1 Tax=Pedobacter steynii TaxID=430522 RepID=A0A1G9TZN8_9SPHI|nr:hypothetical protein [Pedobacter steynii]NQX40602.1 hypothetical protein [Pedobacter steynii]SDM52735.1 hypothetical protein SAMN05421820_1044 [Pedobacter steynii]